MYFRKDWTEVCIKESKYKVIAYPLDIDNNDTIVIRIFKDEIEQGNGLYIDSDGGVIAGNDELDYEDKNTDELVNKMLGYLTREGIV